MSALRASLALLAVIAGTGQALAFKNLAACDLVMAASGQTPFAIEPEAWQSYQSEVSSILAGVAGNDLSQAADRLVEAQESALSAIADDDAYKDYLAGDNCLVLKSLTTQGTDAALAAADPSTQPLVLDRARAVANAVRAQMDMISRSARFRSGRDQTLLAARYYCFAAGVTEALVAGDKLADIPLNTYGPTIGCKDVGRVE
ncbi:hypothetical protein [Methyloceanibacter sp.]|uniref:hypothetical protein n=1 Tax=Methyloceanibacter sp. TaxID=1965321 RepID=UPI002D2BD704|nr:hypothetical protein [Methyloceanibacter sp.]HZP09519.1 hypothetical protein [Methyloceanibacter sp.]